eukprot:TRINITY_DN6753_c0_g10_i1.p1 TRINITY_DN6753_c0_g10~~TRINITY_DN6753_c0_g10_i1.p1  ORF type:complete len:775 (-),score=121.66 TRINITY_DN6753_c0_g10_i1:136-2460(-)
MFGSSDGGYSSALHDTLTAQDQHVESLMNGSGEAEAQSHMDQHLKRVAEGRKHLKEEGAGDQLYPRRWYDDVLPGKLPFDQRETMQEAFNRHDDGLVYQVLWDAEKKGRADSKATALFGSSFFWFVMALLTFLPLHERWQLGGAMRPECYDTDKDLEGCEVFPFSPLVLITSCGVIALAKIVSLDLTRGPFGAVPHSLRPNAGQESGDAILPNMVTGKVPESDREGISGLIERLLAVWKSLGGATVIIMFILIVDFPQRMMHGAALAPLHGGKVTEGQVVLSEAGSLEQGLDIFKAKCIQLWKYEVPYVAGLYFGDSTLWLFLFGILVCSLGELFQIRHCQNWLGKGYLRFEWLLRISNALFWDDKVITLEVMANKVASDFFREQDRFLHSKPGGVPPTDEEWKQFKHNPQHVSNAMRVCAETIPVAQHLLNPEVQAGNISYQNRFRTIWTAAFQAAGLAMLVPASQAGISPCVHGLERNALMTALLSDPVHVSTVLKIGSSVVCCVISAFLFYLAVCLPVRLDYRHFANPKHWPFNMPAVAQQKIQDGYDALPSVRPYLGWVVDGSLVVFVLGAALFGELGGTWLEEGSWLPNPWALWRIQAFLYAAEIGVRYTVEKVIRKGVAEHSPAEKATYQAQVEAHIIDILHQVGESAGPVEDVNHMLLSASVQLRKLILIGEAPAGSAMESGRPLLEKEKKEFIVDNRWLKASTDGMGYRTAKVLDAHDLARPVVPWFSSVFGYDEEDGWVRIEVDGQIRFLPTYLDGQAVLTIPSD